MVVSFGMHFVILYVDSLADMFNVTPLDKDEWMLVLAFSLPVIFIDEILKLAGRQMSAKELKQRMEDMSPHESFLKIVTFFNHSPHPNVLLTYYDTGADGTA